MMGSPKLGNAQALVELHPIIALPVSLSIQVWWVGNLTSPLCSRALKVGGEVPSSCEACISRVWHTAPGKTQRGSVSRQQWVMSAPKTEGALSVSHQPGC